MRDVGRLRTLTKFFNFGEELLNLDTMSITMSDENKRNLQFFEACSMRELYDCLQMWQDANHKRLLSISIQEDEGKFCCIALTNPTEVVITSLDGKRHANVTETGTLYTF